MKQGWRSPPQNITYLVTYLNHSGINLTNLLPSTFGISSPRGSLVPRQNVTLHGLLAFLLPVILVLFFLLPRASSHIVCIFFFFPNLDTIPIQSRALEPRNYAVHSLDL
ncbi:hypothetical protein QBC42DRAFT_69111 [Cladorrhinum samala]|uniref:Uncharacterized protein n=1 Tax=Cladorrhinum samala TaxID=585594 RepID=A0AAV9HT44_9PEZI|nr:hypothetical protein QBC42DRAFT_69111 [Cladorrhinum samala]